jgi:hypothetical protein
VGGDRCLKGVERGERLLTTHQRIADGDELVDVEHRGEGAPGGDGIGHEVVARVDEARRITGQGMHDGVLPSAAQRIGCRGEVHGTADARRAQRKTVVHGCGDMADSGAGRHPRRFVSDVLEVFAPGAVPGLLVGGRRGAHPANSRARRRHPGAPELPARRTARVGVVGGEDVAGEIVG